MNRRVKERTISELLRESYPLPDARPHGHPHPRVPRAGARRLVFASLFSAAAILVGVYVAAKRPGFPPLLTTTPSSSLASTLASTVTAIQPAERLLVHVSVSDPDWQRQTLDEVESLLLASERGQRHVRIEVVANGDGLSLLTTAGSQVASRIAALQSRHDGVMFMACRNTIARVEQAQGYPVTLLPGVTIIDSGVAQIMRRQQQGWTYIRA